jgi:iron-sulfur cluster repair protein YtfE (RIC family)
MSALKNWLFPDTTLLSVLRLRPLALSLLEAMGVDPYMPTGARIGDACRDAGIDWVTLVDRVYALEVPARDSDWKRLPVPHLVDFLTQEHRDFTEFFIPAIKSDFAWGEDRMDFLESLHNMIKAWPGFSASLVEHTTEEEAFLFPKILRYSYCARHHGTDPEFSDGSVKVFAAVHLMRNEDKHLAALGGFLEAASFAGAKDPSAAGVFRLMQSLHARLVEHSRLERELLYPLATDLEKSLYDTYIQGNPSRIAAADLNFA